GALMRFAGTRAYEGWSRYGVLVRASSLLRLAVAATRFAVIGNPAEGAASRDYLAGGDKPKLDERRRTSDDFYRALREAAAANVVKNTAIDEHLKFIDDKVRELAAMREKVDAKTAPPAAITGLLVATSGRAIDAIGTMAAVATDSVLSRRIVALYATLHSGDGMLAQRGAGQAALKDGQAPAGMFMLLASGATRQTVFGKLFNDLAPPAVIRQYQAFDAANGRALQELREIALKNSGTPASPEQLKRWVDLNAEMTGGLTGMFTTTADLFSAEADDMLAAAWRSVVFYLTVTLAGLAVVLVLSRMVLSTLRRLLTGLSHAMKELRNRHYDVAIPGVDRTDELGDMARTTT